MEENKSEKVVQLPVYQKIAADIAAKIAERKYLVGEKIYSRSVIAIRRNGEVLISPGSYATLNEKDIIYFIGDEYSPDRVTNFLLQKC